jgi:hypothetical protein
MWWSASSHSPDFVRHLYVASLLVSVLVVCETAVYFTATAQVEKNTTLNLVKQLGVGLSGVTPHAPPEISRAVCGWFPDDGSTKKGNAKVRLRSLVMVALAATCACLLSWKLYRSTSLSLDVKKLVCLEVVAITVGFVIFDLFFFEVIVKGTEPARATSMLERTGAETLDKLTLPDLRKAAACQQSDPTAHPT